MFDKKSVMEFIKRIIEKESNEEKAIKLIEEFKENLKLTKMADDNSLNQIDIILKDLPAAYRLGKLFGDEKIVTKEKQKTKQKKKKYEDRHYNNYHSKSTPSYSNSRASYDYSCSTSCGGGSSSYSSSCGGSSGSSSYSSHC